MFLFNFLNSLMMNKEVIGFNAGLVWNALCEGETLTLKGLKKVTKLKEKDLYAALGWLAREEKISFEEADDEIFVGLI